MPAARGPWAQPLRALTSRWADRRPKDQGRIESEASSTPQVVTTRATLILELLLSRHVLGQCWFWNELRCRKPANAPCGHIGRA